MPDHSDTSRFEDDLFPLTPVKSQPVLGSGPHDRPQDLATTDATVRHVYATPQVRLVTSEDLLGQDSDEAEDVLMELESEEWLLAYVSDGRAAAEAGEAVFQLRPGILLTAPAGAPPARVTHCSQEFTAYAARIDPLKLGKQLGAGVAVGNRVAGAEVGAHFIGLDFKGLFRGMLESSQHHDQLSRLEVQMAAMVAICAAVRLEEIDSRHADAVAPGAPDIVRDALSQLAQDLASSPTVSQVALGLGVSRGHLNKTFKQHMGISPKQYVQELRLKCAIAMLRSGEDLDTVAHAIGLATVSELRRLFQRHKDCKPEDFLP